jgi:phospholipid/cholesterol/gamma-HCH transport system ATP-binding protein
MIALENVTKSFGEHLVLDDVSVEFPMGKTTAIIGPSGTGKSVLIKHLVGLMQPDAGRVWVLGTDMASASPREMSKVRRRIGMLFQDGALFGSMTVGENIAFPLLHHRQDMTAAERSSQVEEVLEQVELPGFATRSVSDLSGGQRKRVGLARAIVTHPEVVFFDEPNSGLDPITSDSIDALIGHMQEVLGITFLVISHDIVGTLNVADCIGMLYGGKLIAWGTRDEVVRSEHPMVRRFLQRNVELPTHSSETHRLPRT